MNKWMIWGFSHIFGNTHVDSGSPISKSGFRKLTPNSKLFSYPGLRFSGEQLKLLEMWPIDDSLGKTVQRQSHYHPGRRDGSMGPWVLLIEAF